MTDKNGDDDKQDNPKRQIFVSYHHDDELRLAFEKLVMYRAIESARSEHKKLRIMIKAAQERLDKQALQPIAPPSKRSTPPAAAAFLLAFIAPKNSAQALLGDLEEIFQKNTERFGEKQARKMYWFEVARSFGPLIWQWIKRMGIVTLVVDYVRSKFGL